MQASKRINVFLLVIPLVACFLLFAIAQSRATPPITTEKRIALVIGISAYRNAHQLANPVNDARAIGDGLRRLGFKVYELFDPTFAQFSRGLRDFGLRAQGADAAIVYFAGHGIQAEHENYLLPADVVLEQEHDLLFEAIPLRVLLGEVGRANRIGIVLLDACRNNPFADRLTRLKVTQRNAGMGAGMARVDDVPANTLVAMATKADQTADDGSADHSPFAAAILAHFQIPGLELGLFFRSVRDTVLRATNNRQEPYVYSSLGAEPFYFNPRPVNHPPQIGLIRPLYLSASDSPTKLGIPSPTDPDGDTLSIRVTGLPKSGEVYIGATKLALNDVVTADAFATATYKPGSKDAGPVGSIDILVEDGRGGSVTGHQPIIIVRSDPSPIAAAEEAAPAVLAASLGSLDQVMRNWTAAHRVPAAALAVMHKEHIVFTHGYGQRVASDRVPLWGLSRAVTAACVATLVDENRLRFDDPLGTLIPTFFRRFGPLGDQHLANVTVGQLLVYRSGLPASGSWGKFAPGVRELLTRMPPERINFDLFARDVLALPLRTAPGEQYENSNLNYLLLGAVIEAVTFRTYEYACSERVLKRAGIADAHLASHWGSVVGAAGGWALSGPEYLNFVRLLLPYHRELLGTGSRNWLSEPTGKWINGAHTQASGMGLVYRPNADGSALLTGWGTWYWQQANAAGQAIDEHSGAMFALSGQGTGWVVSFDGISRDNGEQAMRELEAELSDIVGRISPNLQPPRTYVNDLARPAAQ